MARTDEGGGAGCAVGPSEFADDFGGVDTISIAALLDIRSGTEGAKGRQVRIVPAKGMETRGGFVERGGDVDVVLGITDRVARKGGCGQIFDWKTVDGTSEGEESYESYVKIVEEHIG